MYITVAKLDMAWLFGIGFTHQNQVVAMETSQDSIGF
jgi:hypothetical protein